VPWHREDQVKIKDIMSSRGLLTVDPDDDLGLAAQILLWSGVRHLPVVRRGEVVGVLSERDLLHHRTDPDRAGAGQEPVARAMQSPAVTVSPDEPVVTAITLMLSRRIGCLPVVGREGLVGMLTRTDLLRHDLQAAVERAASGLPPAVGKVMKRAPAAVTPDTDLFDAVALMSQQGIRHLPVIDGDRQVVGMLSDRDVRAVIGDPRRLLADPQRRFHSEPRPVSAVMSKVVITLPEQAPLTRAVDHLVHEPIGAIPVVDDARRLVGIVSYVDVIQALR
jgi:CBS domain-containing protein